MEGVKTLPYTSMFHVAVPGFLPCTLFLTTLEPAQEQKQRALQKSPHITAPRKCDKIKSIQLQLQRCLDILHKCLSHGKEKRQTKKGCSRVNQWKRWKNDDSVWLLHQKFALGTLALGLELETNVCNEHLLDLHETYTLWNTHCLCSSSETGAAEKIITLISANHDHVCKFKIAVVWACQERSSRSKCWRWWRYEVSRKEGHWETGKNVENDSETELREAGS